MAANVDGDNSRDFRNSDKGISFQVIGKYLTSSPVKFGDNVRENFEAEVKRLGGLASSCHAGTNTGLEGVENEQLVTLSSQGFPDHNEFVPQDFDEGNLESIESVDSLKAQLQEERLLHEAKITDLEREYGEQAKNLKLKLFNEEKEKNAWRKRSKLLEARADKLDSELKEKNKDCREVIHLQEQVSDLQEQVSDLQEQQADLMRHLDAQQAIANAPDKTRQELQDGKVFLGKGPSPGPHQPKKSGRKKGRRR